MRAASSDSRGERPLRLSILDFWVDAVDMEQAVARAGSFLRNGRAPHAVFAVNPEKVFRMREDPLLRETLRKADLLIPDGIGVVWAARLLHGVRLSRVAGADFMDRLCALAARERLGGFLYGAREEVNARAAKMLEDRHPGLKIVGRSHGYVAARDMEALVRRINDSGASILWLALGSPRQERWFAEHREGLKHVRICQGVGGALDALTGEVRRAPPRWSRLGFEWLYRLLREPRRIRRQRVLPLFFAQILKARLLHRLPA